MLHTNKHPIHHRTIPTIAVRVIYTNSETSDIIINVPGEIPFSIRHETTRTTDGPEENLAGYTGEITSAYIYALLSTAGG